MSTQDIDAQRAKAEAHADEMLAGPTTGIEGREQEYLDAVQNVLRTFRHNQGYAHQVNDALVKSAMLGIHFARKHGLLDDYIRESIEVLRPVLLRVRGAIELTGRRELALAAIAGWSTDHFQLVITETHKEPGRRWFLSPFGRVMEAGQRLGQFDFDEAFVVEQFYLPQLRGFADVLGVPVVTTWDPETRIISVALAD